MMRSTPRALVYPGDASGTNVRASVENDLHSATNGARRCHRVRR